MRTDRDELGSIRSRLVLIDGNSPAVAVPSGADASAGPGAGEQAKAAFMLRLRARGIQNLAILRALERVPRELFVPHLYADLARRDLAVPIGCGQTLSEPFLVARMIEALALAAHHRVLEIGTGTGYATAILAEVADRVVSIERYQSLAIAARLRLAQLAKTNADILWGDGLALPPDFGPFERILVHGRLAEVPDRLVALLGEGGQMVLARQAIDAPAQQRIVRVTRDPKGDVAETNLGPCRLQSIVPGIAARL